MAVKPTTNTIRSWPIGSAVAKLKKDMMSQVTRPTLSKYTPEVPDKISPVKPIRFPQTNIVTQ